MVNRLQKVKMEIIMNLASEKGAGDEADGKPASEGEDGDDNKPASEKGDDKPRKVKGKINRFRR